MTFLERPLPTRVSFGTPYRNSAQCIALMIRILHIMLVKSVLSCSMHEAYIGILRLLKKARRHLAVHEALHPDTL